MSHDDARAIELLASEIQEYLDRNPDAADTLEGIVAWWMQRQRFEQSAERVARALDYLVCTGAVKLYRTPGNRWLYRGRDRHEYVTRIFNSEGPMVAKIENLTDKPIWLRLNSGQSVAIAPRALSGELPEHEIDGNAKLDKLVESHTIARHPAKGAAAEAKGDKSKPRRPG